MRGYVARKGDRWYAVVYEGRDPVTGKELRRWHPGGTTREEAEKLAARWRPRRTDATTRCGRSPSAPT
jgi:hypothetical protein